jgi:phosphoadenosine phosphosulfate reductase
MFESAHFADSRARSLAIRPAPVVDIEALRRRFDELPSSALLTAVLRELFPGRVGVVSSFGAESAVLLHLVAAIDPSTPVLFIDTGRHFEETIEYRDLLTAHLGLTDVRTIGPTIEEAARLDPDLTRAVWDPDGCCAFRKTAPLQRALGGFDAWISGRKRFQSATRARLPLFEFDGSHVKINPLARWSVEEMTAYATEHALPSHALVAQGFPSISCAACTSSVLPHEDPRAGRWRGFEKTECGIHLPTPDLEGQ